MADLVSEEDLEKGSLYPPLNTIQKCSLKIAARVAEYAYKQGALHETSCVDMVAGSHARPLLKYILLSSYFIGSGVDSLHPPGVLKKNPTVQIKYLRLAFCQYIHELFGFLSGPLVFHP